MRNYFTFLLCVVLVFTSAIITPEKASAQAYRGIIINQFKFYYNKVERGTTVNGSFTVTHDFEDENKQTTLHVKAMNFTSDGRTGVPVFIKNSDVDIKSNLAEWTSFEREKIELTRHGQVETINFQISVPTEANPGGKQMAILLTEQPRPEDLDIQDEITQFSLNKELGPLVFLTVDGELTEELDLQELFTTNIDNKKTILFSVLPVNINAIIKNKGNTHSSPNGIFYVYQGDNFQDYLYKAELNTENGSILPETTRLFSTTWEDGFITKIKEKQTDGTEKTFLKLNWDKLSHFRIGKYKIKLLYSKDGTQQFTTGEANASFWVIPWQILIILLVTIIIVSFMVYRKMKGKKKENNLK
ncbi:hypothetical protein JW796_03495 [Candidatus Dojkabacteria bacterium]|nr:hypothetical protein [Candidatus Dojkabacteria bacterium]